MTIRQEVPDELLKDDQKLKDLRSENGLPKQLTKAMLERVSRPVMRFLVPHDVVR